MSSGAHATIRVHGYYTRLLYPGYSREQQMTARSLTECVAVMPDQAIPVTHGGGFIFNATQRQTLSIPTPNALIRR